MSLLRSRVLLGGVAALTLALAASTQALPSASGPGPAARPSAHPDKAHTNGWKQLSPKLGSSLSRPDVLALPTGGIQAVWQQVDGSLRDSVRSRIIKENGAIGSPLLTVAQNWN